MMLQRHVQSWLLNIEAALLLMKIRRCGCRLVNIVVVDSEGWMLMMQLL